jgi:polar amino acid transport system substrate-binding protein
MNLIFFKGMIGKSVLQLLIPQGYTFRLNRQATQLSFMLQLALAFFPLLGVAAEFHFVTLQFPPLEYEGEAHRAEGAAVDTVRAIMDRLGHRVTIRVLPWTRALQMVRNGKADAIFTAYKNPERETFLDYSEEILMAQEVFFYRRRGSDFQFDGNISSIREARIGIVSTISYGQVFDRFKPVVRPAKANQLTHNVQKLIKGRIDLLPSNRYVGEYTIGEMGLKDRVERLPQMIESVPSYIAFSKRRDLGDLRRQFDEELGKMKVSGEYASILQQHGIIEHY